MHEDYTRVHFLLSAGQHKPLLEVLTAPVFVEGLQSRNQQFPIYFIYFNTNCCPLFLISYIISKMVNAF